MSGPSVIILGAGPGDPELITIKGFKAIQQADVILYDALSSSELLDHAKPGAECIYVGKRCGQHSLKQVDINTLILQKAREHKKVVRLKGGDPYVFGRGHEEYTFLRKHDILVEVIPGISSVTSLPLLQNVPLTRRNVAESFWVITATTKDHAISQDIILAAQSNATIVILMGMRKIDEIASIYVQNGRADLPAMVISKGSTQEEKYVLGEISTLSHQVKINQIPSPGIIIIGEVVSLHPNYIRQHALSTWL